MPGLVAGAEEIDVVLNMKPWIRNEIRVLRGPLEEQEFDSGGVQPSGYPFLQGLNSGKPLRIFFEVSGDTVANRGRQRLASHCAKHQSELRTIEEAEYFAPVRCFIERPLRSRVKPQEI